MSRNKSKGNCAEELQLIYDGQTKGSTQNSMFSQNWDFSTFPLLCEKTYAVMISEKSNLRSCMPYCKFLHAMNEYLNAYLLCNYSICTEFKYMSMYIPTPIFEYINGIGTVKTASGLEVHFNLPIGGTPQGPLDATDDEAAMESGSFGSCTAETHNSYECYMSPYVTRKLIERTLYANTSTDPDRFGDWSPLPKGRYPENGIGTINLLGYQKPEKLDAEGVAALRKLDFCNDNTRFGQICHSSDVLITVSDVLSRLSHQIAMTEINFCTRSCTLKENSAAFIYLDYSKQIEQPEKRLAEYVNILSSPESFDSHATTKAYYFGYKRQRSPGSVGPCYIVGGEVPKGWGETRNNNFNMIGKFASKKGMDAASLRSNNHIVDQISERSYHIHDWLRRFIIKKVYT